LLASVVSGQVREKQLLCMARAILKRTKVLVMDEVCILSANKSINLNLLGAQQATARYEVGHEYNHHGFDRSLALTMQLMNSLGKRSDSESSLRSIFIQMTDLPLREFAESTILTIAHRLRTVIDYDRVIPICS